MAKWSKTEVYYNKAKTGSLNRPSTIYYLALAAAPVPIAARSLCSQWPCPVPAPVASLPTAIGLDKQTLHSGVQSLASPLSEYNRTHCTYTQSRTSPLSQGLRPPPSRRRPQCALCHPRAQPTRARQHPASPRPSRPPSAHPTSSGSSSSSCTSTTPSPSSAPCARSPRGTAMTPCARRESVLSTAPSPPPPPAARGIEAGCAAQWLQASLACHPQTLFHLSRRTRMSRSLLPLPSPPPRASETCLVQNSTEFARDPSFQQARLCMRLCVSPTSVRRNENFQSKNGRVPSTSQSFCFSSVNSFAAVVTCNMQYR